MASATICSRYTYTQVLFFLLHLLINLLSSNAHNKDCRFDSIYSFGDSIADTGNLLRESSLGAFAAIASLPYGETYFKRPTGRCSNGLLILDFLAMSLGLPLLNPYLEKDARFSHGVNFAVAGATALNTSFFLERNILMPFTNSSLDVQLDWFQTHLKSICSSKAECAKRLEKAVFLVGEIGGNDYNYAFFQGRTIEEVKTYVPHVVKAIRDAAKEVIGAGAVQLIVPGNFPIGCMPSYLTMFQTDSPASYDENKCLKDLNSFAEYHNDFLQKAIEQLRQEFPQVLIFYADYFNTLKEIVDHVSLHGFEESTMLKACCGSGGGYNFNVMKMCGADGVPVCPEPATYISWDGIHLTQQAYKQMAENIIVHGFQEWKCKFHKKF